MMRVAAFLFALATLAGLASCNTITSAIICHVQREAYGSSCQ